VVEAEGVCGEDFRDVFEVSFEVEEAVLWAHSDQGTGSSSDTVAVGIQTGAP
jgi:hypothetical protein